MVAYLHDMMSHCLTAAVYYQGVPVSWCLTHYDGSRGYAYTIKEHRQKNIFMLAMAHLMMQRCQMQEASYAYTITSNKASVHVALNKLNDKIMGEVGHRFYRPASAKL